jgi:hypothetical protein
VIQFADFRATPTSCRNWQPPKPKPNSPCFAVSTSWPRVR